MERNARRPPAPRGRRKPGRAARRCGIGPHPCRRLAPHVGEAVFVSVAAALGAAADPGRLRVLHELDAGPACVTELAVAVSCGVSTVSQRLHVLHRARLVSRRRSGKHVVYAAAGGPLAALVRACLRSSGEHLTEGAHAMTGHTTHPAHDHVHGKGCGHRAVRHGDHVDFLHDGHLHHVHGDHVDDHSVAVDASHADACTPKHACGAHDPKHVHGAACGHPAVPHGTHVDYLVAGHLHHAHGGHCDDHGALADA